MPSRFWGASGNALLPGANTFGSAAAWTPALLPGISTWIEADPTKLYTDSGVTLVSADNQSVQQINDKSGNAHNFRQTTVGQQPVYRTGSGKPYLQFTAANSSTIEFISSIVPGDGTGQHYVAFTAYFNRTSAREYVAEFNGTINVSDFTNEFGTSRASSNNTASTNTADTAGAITAATPCVIIATITSSAIEVFLNNVSDGSTALSGTRENNSCSLILGATGGVASFFDGRIYGLVHGTGLLSSGDRASLQTYMAALHP